MSKIGGVMKSTFLVWLYKQKKRDDPVGDLARDCSSDRSLDKPRKKHTLDGWHDYLFSQNACDGAHSALDGAWSEYKKNKRQGAA